MSEVNPVTGKPWKTVPQPEEKSVDELEGIIAAERRAAASAGEGDARPALSDEVIIPDEEEPPDETEPLLPSVNPKVGPETRSQRAARYAAMRAEAQADLQAMVDSAPADSALKTFLRYEHGRDERMEPLRVAFIKAQGKKGQPDKEKK